MPKHQKWFWLTALVAAWLFDFLFWNKSANLAFFIWIIILLAVGYLLAWKEGKRPSGRSLILTVAIAGFAAVMFLRREEMTRALSVLLSFGGLLLLSATFLDGYWPWYRVRDYVVEICKVIGGGFSGAILLASKKNASPSLEGTHPKNSWSKVWPILRGILIALPILAIFAILLSSADPIFGDWIKTVFNLEKLPEYLFRLFYILLIAGFLTGIYLKAILPAHTAEKPDPNQPWMKPFLGWTEGAIVLTAVNLLFLTFVIIQVRYLFGGAANISETGYTYAEYARKGFFELVAVAVLSLGLYLVLNTITRTEKRGAKIAFSVLSILLMANVTVILASSLMRLMLYEQAYGFSRLRTYTHVFIYWLAALLVVTIVLELIHKRGHMGLALLIVLVGFGASVAILNVDGFIVNQNVRQAGSGEALDVSYLNSLSTDAVPAMIHQYSNPAVPVATREKLGASLACRQKVTNNPSELPWQEFNLSQANAYQLLQKNASTWQQYQPYQMDNEWYILVDGEEIACSSFMGFD